MESNNRISGRKSSLSKLKKESERFNKVSESFCPNRHSILLNQLTEMEIRIVGYFKQGYEPKCIAEELGISLDKLDNYKEEICKQLGGNKI